MERCTYDPTTTTIQEHPFILAGPEDPSDDLGWYCGTAFKMINSENTQMFLCNFLAGALGRHREKPYDAIVGDDVSGRIPTLLLHRFLRLAYSAKHIDTVPRTFFVSSGRLEHPSGYEGESLESKWQRNIDRHASELVDTFSIKSALLVTETKNSGSSLGRVERAFRRSGVDRCDKTSCEGNMWLGGPDSKDETRLMLGVERGTDQEALSHRIEDLAAARGSAFRRFISDYATYMYVDILKEDPPKVSIVTKDPYPSSSGSIPPT